MTLLRCLTLAAALLAGAVRPALAAPPRNDAADPMVLALTELRSEAGAAAASVLWFATALQPTSGRFVVAANHARRGETADFPWVRVDAGGDPVILVLLVREVVDASALADRLAHLLDQTMAAGPSPRERVQTTARLRKDLLEAVAATPPAAPRLIGVNELRLTAGDVASARVGLIVKKQLDFRGEGGSYRLGFQLVRAEQVVAPPPAR